MCGIAGIVGENDTTLLDSMLQSIEHRGPDGHGTYVNEDMMMGARRLSIIDIDGGDQPIANETEDVFVVFNGEIYNQADLRAALTEEGHVFDTECDTEVLVHLWEEHGESMVDHLDGMFAFSIWDSRSETLFLARDPLGVKPLYYSRGGDSISWASEIRPLLIAGVDPSLDQRAVANYFSLKYSPWPGTLFENVQKLPPGSSVTVRGDEVTSRRFWRLSPSQVDGGIGTVATQVRELLEESVRKRLMADTPVGAFLSGGLDSSAVVGLMSQHVDDLHTYSVGFRTGRIDEREEAQFVASHFDTEHTTIEVDLASMDRFDEMVGNLSEPLADPAALPNLILSRRASEDRKVVLTGVGADELFAGYRYHALLTRHRRYLRHLPNQLFEIAEGLQTHVPDNKYLRHLVELQSDETAYLYWRQRYETPPKEYLKCKVDRPGLERLVRSTFPKDSRNNTLQRLLAIDVEHYLIDDLLYLLDHMAMMSSLEGRVPFLDTSLVQYALGIPARFQTRERNKPILRRAVSDLLPKRTLERDKQTFAVPVGEWFNDDHDAIARWFDEDNLDAAPFVDSSSARNLWDDHRRGRADNKNSLWRVLNFVAWYNVVVRPWT